MKLGYVFSMLMLLGTIVPYVNISAEGLENMDGVIILQEWMGDSNQNDQVQIIDSDIITPGNNVQEGLNLIVEQARAQKNDGIYCDLILDIAIMNWEIESVSLSSNVSALLVFDNGTEFVGELGFENDNIGMLEEAKGTITFTVPYYVALADPDDIEFIITVQGEAIDTDISFKNAVQNLFSDQEILFDYDARETDNMQCFFGPFYILNRWRGEVKDNYQWIVQDISLVNWNNETTRLDESLEFILTYIDKYGFLAELDFPKQEVGALEVVNGRIEFQVPKIIVSAEEGTLGLRANLLGEKFEFPFDVANAEPLPVLNVGETITFGTWEQDNDIMNGKEPIEWTVLEVKESEALLISNFLLEAMPYNSEFSDITWENCTLRKWLNGAFLKDAFSETEKSAIILSKINNSLATGNSIWDTYGSNNTEDYIFLLSKEEASYYFNSDSTRKCMTTPHVLAQGAFSDKI